TAYNYGFQLMQVPVGVVGVSVAIALFPRLSRDAALGNLDVVRHQLSSAIRVLLFIALPLTAVMTVLREPLTAVFFQYGLFSRQSTDLTAVALLYFTLGLAAQCLVPILARAFYALQDTATPVLWAIVTVALNIPLMVWLVGPMGVGGLALALSVTASLEVLGLLWALRGRAVTGEAPSIGPPGGSMGLGAMTDRIGPDRVVGVPLGEITSLAYDSRHVEPGALFFAVPGEHTDGHLYVTDAVDAGARAVVVQQELPAPGAPQLVVANSRYALADAADLWFAEPSRHLATIGVTGTNG